MRVLGAEPGCFVPVVSCFFIVDIGVVDRDDVHVCMLRQLPVFCVYVETVACWTGLMQFQDHLSQEHVFIHLECMSASVTVLGLYLWLLQVDLPLYLLHTHSAFECLVSIGLLSPVLLCAAVLVF